MSEISDLEQHEKTTFLEAKDALDMVLHNKRKEMTAGFPKEQFLFEMMEEDEPRGDYVDTKAALAQRMEAKGWITQSAEKIIAKWKDFQIAKTTKRNNEIQNATVRKDILMQEVQCSLPIADQVASLRAQLAKSLILQEEKHKKGQRHGRSSSRSSSRSRSLSLSINPSPTNGRCHLSCSSRSSNSTCSTRSRTLNHSSTTRYKGKGKQQRRSNKQEKREPPRRSTNPRPKSRPRSGKRGYNDCTRRGNGILTTLHMWLILLRPCLFCRGDPIGPPPNYLRLFFSLGPKYVPHQNPLRHLRHQMTTLRTEVNELKRVLAWSALFDK